jgi:hypothetical protein
MDDNHEPREEGNLPLEAAREFPLMELNKNTRDACEAPDTICKVWHRYIGFPGRIEMASPHRLLLVSAFAIAGSLAGVAQAQQADPFQTACDAALTQIQANSRVCIIGVVLNDTEVRVLSSNKPGYIFKKSKIFQSPVQQGQEVPLEGLGRLKDSVVAIGGFDNTNTVYSAKLLSP